MRKAVVRRSDGKVLNVIVWVEGTAWAPPIGCVLVDAEKDGGPGDTWDGSAFVRAETLSIPSVPTLEDRVKKLEAKVGVA